MKTCTLCNIAKEDHEFYKRCDGILRSHCIPCISETHKKYRNMEKNKEKRRASYLNEREKRIARSLKWGRENKEKRKEINKKYCLSHPWIKPKSWINRRQKERQAPGFHTAEQLLSLLVSQDFQCRFCKSDLTKVKKHADHIVPISKGGTHYIENIQYLCSTCNVRKGTKTNEEFKIRIDGEMTYSTGLELV